jgi:hypothetical protein
LSTSGPPQQDKDSAQAQAPSSLSAHEWTTWISRSQFSQTYTSPAFISLHDAIFLTSLRIPRHGAGPVTGVWVIPWLHAGQADARGRAVAQMAATLKALT